MPASPSAALTDFGRPIAVPGRWLIHGYYTLCPYAPDGSGRILAAGADLQRERGEVLVLSADGHVLDRFGDQPLSSAFFHTGYWQTWSPDARYVYFQGGDLTHPRTFRRDLVSGEQLAVDCDMEGAPPDGEPIVSGLMGMLYAAGYGTGKGYQPEIAPVPFRARDKHGLFEARFDPPRVELKLSVAEVLERHPDRDRLHAEDRAMRERLGPDEGLTLMTYCVRWSPTGERFLFYFGNHNVDPARGEPRLAYVMTADRQFGDIQLAMDLSFGRRGTHWSWHPDGQRLLGYGPSPADAAKVCVASVACDGSDHQMLLDHHSFGHPSISPADHNLLVTDSYAVPGAVEFFDLRTSERVGAFSLPRTLGEQRTGRNRWRIDNHPVWSRDGRKLLINTLPAEHGVLLEVDAPTLGAGR